MKQATQKGVTLVELLVVMLITALLMAVAVPSYRQYTLRSNRAEGQAMLLQAAANQERFYLQANRYATPVELEQDPPGGLGMSGVSESGLYELSVVNADDESFVVAVRARVQQAADQECAVLALDASGNRYGGPGPVFADNNNHRCW
jgi:type IV pilus assembly protein PilE